MGVGIVRSRAIAFCLCAVLTAAGFAQSGQQPSETNRTSATSVQAPTELTQKITELVRDGKYAEAQQLTVGLLHAYPNDQRLLKAKDLIGKLLAEQPNAVEAPSGQPQRASAPPLTGMDKVDYNALVELAREAQESSDPAKQRESLTRFMTQSATFLEKHPGHLLLWQLRASSALVLDEPMAGFEAGQKLLEAGAADSNDQGMLRLLGQLKNRGWLDKESAEAAREKAETKKAKANEFLIVFKGEAANDHYHIYSVVNAALTKIVQSRFPGLAVHVGNSESEEHAMALVISLEDTKWHGRCGIFSCDVDVTARLLVALSSADNPAIERSFNLSFVRNVSKGNSSFGPRLVNPKLPGWLGEEMMPKVREVVQ